MMVQQSAFTMHCDPKDLREFDGREDLLIQCAIPATAKDKLRVLLGRLGVSRSTIFPDLTGLTAELISRRVGDPEKW